MADGLIVNIDVADLTRAVEFYSNAFGLTISRHLGPTIAEMKGWPVTVYLLEKLAGSIGAGSDQRRYDRHWTPVHFDVIVDDLDAAVRRVTAAGGKAETNIISEAWGKFATLSDPFGNGFCVIEFSSRGYDAIAT